MFHGFSLLIMDSQLFYVTVTTTIVLILTLYLGIAHIKNVQALVYQPEFKNFI
jgi:hypothetical protein